MTSSKSTALRILLAILIPAVVGVFTHVTAAANLAAATTTSLATGAVPRPDHVVVVIEENHSYSSIIGNTANAPYINSLAGQGASFTQSFAITHPSEPNYLALFSGSTQGITDDSCPHTFSAANLGQELIGANLTFDGYSESMPSDGYTGCTSGTYARKHNPWVNFTNVPSTDNLTFNSYPTNYASLPTLSVVVPNLQNDMHDGTIAQGDTWLKTNIDGYAQWAKTHNSLLVVTWDEDDSSAGNQVPTIFVGQQVKPGTYSEQINHYNVLRTLEDAYALPYAGASASATPITDVWATGGVTVTNPGNQTSTVGTATRLQINASDTAGGTLSYAATGLPAGLTINATSGLISGTPTTAGTSTVSVTATDSTGPSASTSFTWTINPAGANTVTVTNPGNQTGTVGTAASLQIHASDSATGQTLTYAATGLPAGLAINAGTGLISGTPSAASNSSVTVTATDTTGAAGSASFSWTIAAASGCTANQLFGNPGFETGSAAPWTSTSGVINNSTSEPPHSGSWDAWLDGYGSTHTDTLAQAVTLPTGCANYTFSFWLHIDTAETTTTAMYDTLTVQVLNSSGSVLTTVATFSNLDHNTGYTQHSYSLGAYAGQAVTVKFTGTEDYTQQTSFVIDDTALNVS